MSLNISNVIAFQPFFAGLHQVNVTERGANRDPGVRLSIALAQNNPSILGFLCRPTSVSVRHSVFYIAYPVGVFLILRCVGGHQCSLTFQADECALQSTSSMTTFDSPSTLSPNDRRNAEPEATANRLSFTKPQAS